jgi:protein-S-isoprenylcysteine O-methyltransferase Ste14
MDDERVFKLAFIGIVIAFVAHRGYYHWKYAPSGNAVIKQPKGGIGTRIANLISIFAMVATYMYLVKPTYVEWASLVFDPWFRWLGVVVAIFGFGLLQWSHSALGTNWSYEPSLLQDHQMVSNGPYRWIRHPIYSAFLLIMISTLPVSANGLVGVLWIAMTAIAVFERIRVEEALMLAQFGDKYDAYMRATGRLLPRIRIRSK